MIMGNTIQFTTTPVSLLECEGAEAVRAGGGAS